MVAAERRLEELSEATIQEAEAEAEAWGWSFPDEQLYSPIQVHRSNLEHAPPLQASEPSNHTFSTATTKALE